MCGRYVLLRPDIRALLKRLNLEDLVASLTGQSRYNIGPGQTVPAVRRRPGAAGLELASLGWGQRIASSEAPGRSHFVINARAESVAQRPAFRPALDERRCALPASGFYEWRRSGAKPEPWYFQLEGDDPFFLAGLWSPDGPGEDRCVVLTTGANERLSGIHHRMPVMLTAEAAAEWLAEGAADSGRRKRLLQPFPAERMKARRVSERVNDARNEDPACLDAWSGGETQTELLL